MAPHIICKSCKEILKLWTTGNQRALKFGISMIWREPAHRFDDCYFCMTNLVGYNKKNRKNILYPPIPSATRPIPHSDKNPVPVFKELPDIPILAASLAPEPVPEELTESDLNPESLENDNDIDYHECSSEPNRFNQDDLSDLIRDLNLSKKSAELLASRLQERNFLQAKTNVTFYRNREDNFLPYFKQYEKIVCNDLELLIMELGIVHYEANSWRLFNDSSKRSLKCAMLHNTNEYASIPIGHSTTLKEKYEPVKQVLECIKYNQHNWKICVDLKMVNFLLGQQSGYTKHPCFLCMWGSRDKANHWLYRE